MSYPLTRREAEADERGIDDASIDREEALRLEYLRAEAMFRDVLAKVARTSMFYTKDIVEAFNDFAHDCAPHPDFWAEKIAEVANG